MSRLEKLQAMLEKEPGDTFLQYAIAMEHRSLENYVESRSGFESLIQGSPPYIPAYFMLGQLLVEIDEVNEARRVLREGIELARSAGDSHAAGEMSEFLASLGAYGE